MCRLSPASFVGCLKTTRLQKATRPQAQRYFYVCVCFQGDEGPVHAVLGGPEPDVDTVAATLCLALHLSQVTGILSVCVHMFSMCSSVFYLKSCSDSDHVMSV